MTAPRDNPRLNQTSDVGVDVGSMCFPQRNILPRTFGQVSVGIDPGASGALVIIRSQYTVECDVTKMPDSRLELAQWAQKLWQSDHLTATVCVEQVGGFIGTRTEDKAQGDHKRNMASGHTMFKFGENYGHINMALVAAGFRDDDNIIPVSPHTWHKEFNIKDKSRGETQTSYKNRIKVVAQELFPDLKVTKWMADALLIAEYCRRRYVRAPSVVL